MTMGGTVMLMLRSDWIGLDRAVADSAWRHAFGDARLYHLVSSRSNHCPLFLEVKKENWERHKIRVFRYEIMWERIESLAVEIRKAWCSAPNRECLGGIMNAINCVQKALRSWSKEHFGQVTNELESLRQQLEEIKGRPDATRVEVRAITDRMDELLYREEMIWLQRSRITWLK
jgi:hypothetical protein